MDEQLTNRMQLFMVMLHESSSAKFITWALGREDAKHKARGWFGHYPGEINPDNYIVTPITNPGDRVHLDITLNI